MKTVLLKLDDSTIAETDSILSNIKKSRNKYLNDAIVYYNRIQKRKILEKKMQEDSYAVREESMKVLKEFEDIDYAD